MIKGRGNTVEDDKGRGNTRFLERVELLLH